MKTCSNCKLEKPLTEFNYKTGRNLQPWCKICSRAESRRHYHSNKESYLIKQRKRNAINREEINQYVNEIKSTTPCTDCGKLYPHYVMDFDHLHDKKFEIGRFAHCGYSLEIVKEEIKKCELVCSNCHRSRTWIRRKLKCAELDVTVASLASTQKVSVQI